MSEQSKKTCPTCQGKKSSKVFVKLALSGAEPKVMNFQMICSAPPMKSVRHVTELVTKTDIFLAYADRSLSAYAAS